MSKGITIPQNLQEFAELFEELYPDHSFDWKPYPQRWMALCPFHEEKHPSFNIFITPDGILYYKCFSCGESGSVYKLLKKHGRLEKEQEQGEEYKQKEKERNLRSFAEEFVREAKDHLLDSIKQDKVEVHRLKSRVIPKSQSFPLEEAIEFYSIGLITESLISEWSRRGGDYSEFLRKADERVRLLSKEGYFVFPYYSLSGDLVAFKLRDISSSSRSSRVFKLYKKTVPAYFGGLGFLKNWLKRPDGWVYPVIITEGETDAISTFLSSKIPTLAVGSASNYAFLLEDRLSNFNFFPIIFPDFDPFSLLNMGAGREAIARLYKELRKSKEREKIYVLADSKAYRGAKDINEGLTVSGIKIEEIFKRKNAILPIREAVSRFYEEWQEWKLSKYEQKQKEIEEQLKGLSDVYVDYLSIKRTREKKVFSVNDIENTEGSLKTILGRFPVGEPAVIASFGGVGKTTYAMIMSFEIGAKENKKVLLWTTEHSVLSLKERLLRIKETSELREFYELGRDKVGFRTDMPEPFINSKKDLNDKAFKELRQLLKEYDVIILDPLLTFVEGEENDNVIVRKVINRIRSLLSEFEGKVVIFLHHFGKLALNEALLDNEDIEGKDGNLIRISREKVEKLIKSVRGASAIVDTSRYVEAIVLTKGNRERYIVTIKTNENTRQEGEGEKIPSLFTVQEKKNNLFERVRSLVLVEKKVFSDSPEFKKLSDYGIHSYSDFEELYLKVPLEELEKFVNLLERIVDEEEENSFDF